MAELHMSVGVPGNHKSKKITLKKDTTPKAERINDGDWKVLKQTVEDLYCGRNYPLEKVMDEMKTVHGFVATRIDQSNDRYKFGKWGWKKYNQPSKLDPEGQGNLGNETGAELYEDGTDFGSPHLECDPNHKKTFSRYLFKELINRLDTFPEDVQHRIRKCFPTTMDLFKEIIDGVDTLPEGFECHARRYLYWFTIVISDTKQRREQGLLSEVEHRATDPSRGLDVIEIFIYFLQSLRAGQRGPFDPDSPYFIPTKDGLKMGHVIMTFFVSALIAATARKSGLPKATSNFELANQGVNECLVQAFSDGDLEEEVVDAVHIILREPGFLEELSRAVDYECKLLLVNECGYQGNDQFTQVGYAQAGYFE